MIGARVAMVLALTAGAALAQMPQVKDDLLAETEKFSQGATDVTEVNMDRKMLDMVRGKNKGGDYDLARRMDFVVVHTYTYEAPGLYKREDVEAYREKLAGEGWNCSNHKSGETDTCLRSIAKGGGSEMVVMTAEPRKLTFAHLRGRMSLEELNRMNGVLSGLNKLSK